MVNCSDFGFNFVKQDLEIGVMQILIKILLDEFLSIVLNGGMVIYSFIYNKVNVLLMVFIDGCFKVRLLVINGCVCVLVWLLFL